MFVDALHLITEHPHRFAPPTFGASKELPRLERPGLWHTAEEQRGRARRPELHLLLAPGHRVLCLTDDALRGEVERLALLAGDDAPAAERASGSPREEREPFGDRSRGDDDLISRPAAPDATVSKTGSRPARAVSVRKGALDVDIYELAGRARPRSDRHGTRMRSLRALAKCLERRRSGPGGEPRWRRDDVGRKYDSTIGAHRPEGERGPLLRLPAFEEREHLAAGAPGPPGDLPVVRNSDFELRVLDDQVAVDARAFDDRVRCRQKPLWRPPHRLGA